MTCDENISAEEVREYLIDYAVSETDGRNVTGDFCIVPVNGDVRILYRQTDGNTPEEIGRNPYYSIPKCYGLMEQEQLPREQSFDTLALLDAGILQVQGQPLSLTGRGVIIGFIDTGIRYTQEVFQSSAGSRIVSIWDQTLQSGKPPEGFLYGTEYDRNQINQALRAENPREIVQSWDENGHGTALASAAAGSSLQGGRRFSGAAPEADLAVVKLRQAKRYIREYYLLPKEADAYAETDLIMAVKYLEHLAVDLERPVVICLGIGTSYGGHTASSVLDRYLNTLAEKRSRAIVVCSGNEGAAGHHYRVLAEAQSHKAELRVGEGESGFLLELWAEGPIRFHTSLRTPGGEYLERIDSGSSQMREYRFVFDRTIVQASTALLEESSGRSLLLLRLIQPTAGVWSFTLDTDVQISGSYYDMWLPITEFLHSDTYFLQPDPNVTLTAPSMTQGVITVGAYQDANGAFYERSGRGFTADRRIKPDFAAPGVEIPTSLGKWTGSSMAAALTAGAAAQLMQWCVVEKNYPLASGRELKYYLALGAERSDTIQYPSRAWGLGKINLQRSFQELSRQR